MNHFHSFLKYVSFSLVMICIFSFPLSTNARTTTQLTYIEDLQTQNEDSIYSFVEKMPEFPGGEKALVAFLNKTIAYPDEAQKKNEYGKVIVQFVISKNGKVENAKVVKSISPSLDNEALHVISLLPDWTPGEKDGQKVSVYRLIPIMFQNLAPKDSSIWEPNEKTLVVIDDVKMPANFNTNILNSEKLASLVLLQPFPKEEKSKLMSKYGRQAADGVILITSKKSEIEYAYADTLINKLTATGGCTEETIKPEFQGGETKLMSYIADSIQYPFVAKRTKTQGKVFVQFLVNTSGKISKSKVVRPVDYFLDKEALRVVNAMPDWIPGSKCGQKLNIFVTVPVIFKLELTAEEKGWERNNKTVILLDGVRLPSSFNPEWVNYAQLTSYQVLQPSTKEITKKLVSQYGRDAVNGVILIGTKQIEK